MCRCSHPRGRVVFHARFISFALALVCLVVSPFAFPLRAAQSAAAAPDAPSQSAPDTPTTIVAGTVIDRAIAGNESHPFQITVPAGQCASLVVDQRGIDLAIDVLDADGKVAVTFDVEKRRTAEEKFTLIGTGAPVRFNVRAVYFGAEPARYQLQLAEIRPATAVDLAIDQAHLLGTSSDTAYLAGNYGEAMRLETQAVELAEKNLPPDDPFTARLVLRLALVIRVKGDFAKAEPLFQRSLDMYRRSRGEDDPQTALAIGDQGLVYISRAEYAPAADRYQKAIEISKRTLSPDDPQVALLLSSLANTESGRGNLQGALTDYMAVLAIYRKYLAPDAEQTMKALYNIGDTYLDMGESALSQKYTLESLAIAEKKFGPDHPYLAYPLQNLGILARENRNYDQALEYLWRSEKIREKALGPRHPITATLLVNIGNVYHDKGDYNEAIKLMLQGLDILESTSGPYNPSTLKTLASIQRTYAANDDRARAYEFQARMDAMIEKSLSLNLATGSEREKLTYIDTITRYNQRSIWESVAEDPTNQAAADGAAAAILQRKGRVLDALAESVGTLRSHLKPEDQALLDQLSSTTSDLAKLSLAGPRKTPLDEYERQLRALESKRDTLEAGVSQRSHGYFEPSSAVTLAAVTEAIPENAALVEYATYKPYYPKIVGDDEQYGESRYVAFVLSRHGKVAWADLGSAKEIDAAVAAWRGALADPNRKDALSLARTLDAKVMAPVRALTGNATHLLISPDDQLNLIPFEALVDEHQKFLVERYSISYLTSGRDLLRMQSPRASRGAPMVVANPLFGEAAGTLVAQSAGPASSRATSSTAARRSITSGSTLADVYFAPLPGTLQEARAIQALFPGARVVSGSDATKLALTQAQAPQILHIATHGFFLQDPAESLRPENAGPLKNQNPLLRAGLALSGANSTKDGTEDGILTGLEAASLDLWGTKLVTLSACETGVGTVKDGEGVFGLRRAFFLAGTETLVMSLWEVSDRVTREMMTTYYGGLKRGLGRGEALRQAQLEMLKRKDRRHPFYWASFIQAGEWANLDGHR